MNERSQDAGLETYLGRRSSLSRRYRELDDDAPSPELDARVLAEARQAIEQADRARSRSIRWLAPLAVAATVVLTVAVVLDVMQEPPVERPPGVERSTEQALGSTESAAVSRSPAEAGPARDSARPESQRRQAPSVPTANAEGRVRSTTSGEFTPDAETELPAREASRAEQTTAPIDGSAAMTVPHSRRDAPAGTRSLALEQDESGSAASGTQVPKQQDPDTWLERIEALRDEGRTAEADAELERFRQAYPDRALLDAGASRE